MAKFCKLCTKEIHFIDKYVIIHGHNVCKECVNEIEFEIECDCLTSDYDRFIESEENNC